MAGALDRIVEPARGAARSALRLYGGLLYPWARRTAGPLVRWLFTVRAEGLEHVPRRGPAVIAANHLSVLDPVFVVLVLPRRVTFLGKIEYARDWKTRWLLELGGVIPVDRDDAVRAEGSLRAGVAALRRGELVGIFPEGTRSPDGRLYKGKTGAARMALEAGCPVIPAGLRGTREVLPKEARVPKLAPVRVRFGEPRWPPPEARDDHGALRAFTDGLMQAIAGLSGQEYRHRYAYQKKLPWGWPPGTIA